MTLSCPKCAASIPAVDVQLDLLIAKCASCDAVFSFADQVGHHEAEVLRRVATNGEWRPPTPTEHSVEAHEEGGVLTLEVPWWSWHFVMMVPFLLFWNGFLVVWWSIALSEGQVAMAAFSLLHVGAGIGLAYYTACGFLNATTVAVSKAGIATAHGPLPWPGARTLDAAGLEQLFVKERFIRGENSVRTVYDLTARHRQGELVVVSGLPDPNSARYLEHRIEKWLGIEDRAVPGEHV